MPSGRTHDRITLWGLPFVSGITFWETESGNLTLLVSGAFLFSGLMFGPDLDLHSIQYKRWGLLRWIWIPYQRTLRHRSFLSHGPIVGTTLRVLYLVSWLGIMGIFILIIATLVWDVEWHWHLLASVKASLTQYSAEWISVYLGLELGAMSHSVSDWGGSAYKRFNKQGGGSLLPRAKMKRRKMKKLKSMPDASSRSKTVRGKSRQKH